MKFTQAIQKYRLEILTILLLRFFSSTWLAVVWIIVKQSLPLSSNYFAETYYSLTPSRSLIGQAFIDVWLRWDAVHYMNIAAFGYQGVGKSDSVFFPLYPYLVGGVSKITTINVTVIGILISSLAALFTLICLRELVIQLFNDEKLANWSTVLFAIYPTAFFLHAPYTDALFLLCVIASILLMIKKKNILAGLLACASGLIRPQGVLLLIPMVVLYIQGYLLDKKIFRWQEMLAVVITPLGAAIYSIWRSTAGMVDIIQSLNQYSSVRFQNPLITLYKGVTEAVLTPTFIEISELLSVLLFLAVIIWMFFQREFRRHWPLMLYSTATWLLITSKTTINASTLQSSNRYVLHIFFAFVGMAAITLKWPAKMRGLVGLIFAIGMLVAATLYSLWIFVG